MERRAVFNAALRLIKEGKFHATPLAEIAFHANIAASTIPYFFASRQIILNDLAGELFSELLQLTTGSSVQDGAFEEIFFARWNAIHDYYLEHPEVIPFVEQADDMPLDTDQTIARDKYYNELAEFFAQGMERKMIAKRDPGRLAALFHESILSAARVNSRSEEKETERAHILWQGIQHQEGTMA